MLRGRRGTLEGSIEDGPGHGGRVDQAMVGRGNQRDEKGSRGFKWENLKEEATRE